jgi:hypothetical protein
MLFPSCLHPSFFFLRPSPPALCYSRLFLLTSPSSEAKFIVPALGDIHSRLRPASLWSLAGWYGNPMSESTISRQSGTKNLATGLIPVSSFSGLHLEHSPSSPSHSFKSYRYCTGVFIQICSLLHCI